MTPEHTILHKSASSATFGCIHLISGLATLILHRHALTLTPTTNMLISPANQVLGYISCAASTSFSLAAIEVQYSFNKHYQAIEYRVLRLLKLLSPSCHLCCLFTLTGFEMGFHHSKLPPEELSELLDSTHCTSHVYSHFPRFYVAHHAASQQARAATNVVFILL
jgi:hypothetical protein